MLRLRTFLRRRILWVGFIAVTIPLLAIIALQYRSLNELKKTSSVAENVWMKNYLADVSKEVKYFYRSNAEQALTTSASAIGGKERPNGKSLFGKSNVEGAKLLFVASIRGDDPTSVYFYDPSNIDKPITPSSAESRAVNLAMAPLRLLSEEEVPKDSPGLMVDEYDPENRVIFKPIRNEERKVVGVSGLIIDTDYFRNVYLPRVIQQSLPKFFPADAQNNVIVTSFSVSVRLDDVGTQMRLHVMKEEPLHPCSDPALGHSLGSAPAGAPVSSKVSHIPEHTTQVTTY